MTKLGVFLFVVLALACSGLAYAQEPTVLEDPKNAFDKIKEVIEVVDPQADAIWNLENNEVIPGFSGSLFNFSSNDIHLASLRTGYGMEKIAYGQVKVDVFGLGRRFLPDEVKAYIKKGTPEPVRTILEKHAAFGLIGGYDFDKEVEVYGVTVGTRIAF